MSRKDTEFRRTFFLQRPRLPAELLVSEQAAMPRLGRHVPLWVLEEFEHFPELRSSQHLIKIVQSTKVTAHTWNKIANLESRRIKIKDLSVAQTATQSFLKPLAEFVSRGLAAFDEEARLTRARRREIARSIQDGCTMLEKALSRFEQGEYQDWDRYLHDAIRDATRVARETARTEKLVASAAADIALHDPCAPLRLIRDVAKRWEMPRRPSRAKPTLPTARRDMFILTLHAGLMRRYGESLLMPVIQIASVFFRDAEHLTGPTVSRLIKNSRGGSVD